MARTRSLGERGILFVLAVNRPGVSVGVLAGVSEVEQTGNLDDGGGSAEQAGWLAGSEDVVISCDLRHVIRVRTPTWRFPALAGEPGETIEAGR